MKHLDTVAAAVLALSLVAMPVDAQQISFEGRGALTFPTGDFGDRADGDAGFGADVFVNVSPRLSVYGGYQYEMYECAGCDTDGYTANGFEAGAKLLFSREGGILPWAKIGAIFNTLEVEEGLVDAESDRGIGLQAAVGADIPLGETLSFSPALRYQTWSADFDVFGELTEVEVDVSSFALDLGLHVHPGG